MRKNTGYVNSFDVIDINKGEVTFDTIYKEDILKKLEYTYKLYYNKSMDSIPNSDSNVAVIQAFLTNLTNNYNELSYDSNILNSDELIRLKKIYDVGVATSPSLSITTVTIPTTTINDLLDDINRFELIKESLTEPDLRKYYFQVYSTSNEYTDGEANFDSLIITNSQNLSQMITDITNTAEDLRNADIHVYANLAAFPSTGILNEVYYATDTRLNYIWNGSAYVRTTSWGLTGANKLNIRLNRELNDNLETVKADAIEFAVHFANLIKYLYYGIKNPDLGNEGITLDLYNFMKAYFNTRYPQFNLTPFERFNEVPLSNHYYGKSFRKIALKLYGGSFNGFAAQTDEVEMDSIRYFWRDLLQPLYFGSNSYKANLSNVIPTSIKNTLSISNTDKDTIYNQLNVLLRVLNCDVITSYREDINDGYQIETHSISGEFQAVPKISIPYGYFYYNIYNPNTITLTSDFYNYLHFARTWGSPYTGPLMRSVITNFYTTKSNNILDGDLYPLVKGIWNNASNDQTYRLVAIGANLKHKCNALYSIIHSTITSGELNRVNEFDESSLFSTFVVRSTVLGQLVNSPSAIGMSSSAQTAYTNLLSSLNIPLSFWGSLPITIPYNNTHLSGVIAYDSEAVFELAFHGITP